MTTTIKLHVGGRYVASVVQDLLPAKEVHGDYDGSPNPTGDATFYLSHESVSAFVITERYLDAPVKAETEPQTIASDEVGTLKDVGLSD